MKRQDYISWDEYFMGIALLTAQRSKDNSDVYKRQVRHSGYADGIQLQ